MSLYQADSVYQLRISLMYPFSKSSSVSDCRIQDIERVSNVCDMFLLKSY